MGLLNTLVFCKIKVHLRIANVLFLWFCSLASDLLLSSLFMAYVLSFPPKCFPRLEFLWRCCRILVGLNTILKFWFNNIFVILIAIPGCKLSSHFQLCVSQNETRFMWGETVLHDLVQVCLILFAWFNISLIKFVPKK